MLCHTDEGVYTYAQFNTTQRGKNAKEQIKHGDITNLSIYANKLHEIGNLVKDGDIKEVSLVIAGANPGACIDHVVVHGDNSYDISAEIYTDEEILVNEDGSYLSISHSDIEEENQNGIEAVLDTLTDKQIDALYTIVNRLSSLEHNDEDDETVNEALEELKDGDIIIDTNGNEYEICVLEETGEKYLNSFIKQSILNEIITKKV